MNRLLSIVVTLFVLFLFYIWINHLIDGVEPVDSVADNAEAPVQAPETPTRDKVAVDDLAKPPSAGEGPVPDSQTGEKTGQLPQFRDVSEDGQGVHLVIAGNFLDRTNASKMAGKLKALGYENSEIVRFELSEYYTVCAGRFQDESDARRTARFIEDRHSIDTYVRIAN